MSESLSALMLQQLSFRERSSRETKKKIIRAPKLFILIQDPKKALNLNSRCYQNIFQFGPLTVATGEKRRVAIAREGNLLRVALL